MSTYLFRGSVRGGQLRPDDPVRWAGRLARLEGRRVQFSVKREQHGRSISQNSYLWGVVYATLAEWSGHEPEEIHEALKELFLGQTPREFPSGDKLMVRPSTTSLTVEEFSGYVDKINRWAAERGCFIPSAEEVG